MDDDRVSSGGAFGDLKEFFTRAMDSAPGCAEWDMCWKVIDAFREYIERISSE